LLIFLFLTLERLEIGPEGVALGCAIIALALTKIDPAEIFKELDWETLFFIAGFMFIVSGLEKTKIINDFSVQLFQLAGQNSFNASILTLFFTGLASMVISNVAVALTFTPIINSQVFQGINSIPIWSALVLGTNLGGAATPFSGTVCVMAIGALKREGISVNFKEFTKIGLATTVIQLAFSALYLVVRFKLIGV
jgi:Na+/H+ antiporter NhaD/arsenite permease-like protein